jgi:hypothetical protein
MLIRTENGRKRLIQCKLRKKFVFAYTRINDPRNIDNGNIHSRGPEAMSVAM